MAVFGLVAVLYNPLFKIHLEREVHAVVNVIVAVLFAAIALRFRRIDVN